jgi:polysaccharide pyruvyl transferase WcaK-like protein
MRVALWGYYGPNYGDNIMLKVIIDYLNKMHIEVEIVDLYDISNYLNIDTKIIKFKEKNKLQKLYSLYKLSKKNVINIWGGGTIFTDCDGDGNFGYFRMIKIFGGKIAYLGIGIGKLTNKERIEKTKYLLKKCEFSIFRDNTSLEKANNLSKSKNYYLAEDLSYIYFNKFITKQVQYSNYVLLTWRNLVGYMNKQQEKDLMTDIVESCIKLCDDYNIKNVLLVPLDEKFDNESCEYILKMFNNKINVYIDDDNSIDNVTNLICNAKFHFSGRLHGCIASEFFNTPTYGLSYSLKMKYFYQSISSNDYFDIYKEKIDYEKIKNIVDNKKCVSKSKFVSGANKNLHLLRELL